MILLVNMKIKKLNISGFSHHLVLMVFVLVFAIAGVGYLVASHAMPPTGNHQPSHPPRLRVLNNFSSDRVVDVTVSGCGKHRHFQLHSHRYYLAHHRGLWRDFTCKGNYAYIYIKYRSAYTTDSYDHHVKYGSWNTYTPIEIRGSHTKTAKLN